MAEPKMRGAGPSRGSRRSSASKRAGEPHLPRASDLVVPDVDDAAATHARPPVTHGLRQPHEGETLAIRDGVNAMLDLIGWARTADPAARVMIALAGPPGAGKSTLSAALVRRLGAEATVLPMDGFHLDNEVLDAKGLRARKGAPATFDVAGFASMVGRVRRDRGPVLAPVFDRRLDLARAGATEIAPRHRIVVVEGNYLLLDEAPWPALAGAYDARVMLRVPESVVEERILARWRRHGLDERAARARALENDIPNARLVLRSSGGADLTLDESGRALGVS